MIRIVRLAALLALAAPLHAQPSAPRPSSACVMEASATAGTELTRRGCAGAGVNHAVRVSVALPTNWRITLRDTTGGMELQARDGGAIIAVVSGDQLPAPLTRQDTLVFWRRAAETGLGREVTPIDVEDVRDYNNGRIAAARLWVTSQQLRDSALLAMAREMSAEYAGDAVTGRETEVRQLAGEPAGYVTELIREADGELRAVSYITVRDGVLFIVTLNVPERDYAAVLPLFERVLASLAPRTERW
jgi:hypothetical protein